MMNKHEQRITNNNAHMSHHKTLTAWRRKKCARYAQLIMHHFKRILCIALSFSFATLCTANNFQL